MKTSIIASCAIASVLLAVAGAADTAPKENVFANEPRMALLLVDVHVTTETLLWN